MSKAVLFPKYVLRCDLSVSERFRLANLITYFFVHGMISRLSSKYNVSRQFFYSLKKDFALYEQNYCASGGKSSKLDEKGDIIEQILSLRLECKSSIEGISSHLSRFGAAYSSVGFISGVLKTVGERQESVLPNVGDVKKIVFCSDEIFSKGEAILITVDPHSLAILSISLSRSRSGESWESHWSSILLAGYEPILLCNDEGTGMASAKQNIMGETARQGDTFHAVSHRFGLFVERFEKAAYKAIAAEYDCKALAERSKTFSTYEKRYKNYQAACEVAKQKIALFDSFTFLYHCLLEQFQVFDNQGVLKNYECVLLDFDTALDLLLALNHSAITTQVKHIEACKGDLFHFRTIAKTIVEQLAQQIPTDTLNALCLAWQTQKKEINAKQTKRKNALKRKKEALLESLRLSEQQNLQRKEYVFGQLDQIVQSSAAVECINSILRPYLVAAKNQISQEALNLFMAYHNHRRFRAGKRKGKTPFELLTNQVQEKDWMQIILEKAA